MKNIHIAGQRQRKKAPTWLWVLGWICIFPIPLTILMLRKKGMKPVLKYCIIAVAWVAYIIIAVSGGSGDNSSIENSNDNVVITKDSNKKDNAFTSKTNTKTEKTEPEKIEGYALIDKFITEYNKNAITPIIDAEEMDISEDSDNYRTEYRLTAFKNAEAKKATIGDATIDIVSYGSFNNDTLRAYVLTDSEDFAVEVFTNVAKLMYPNVSKNELNDAVTELRERDNGSYLDDLSFYYVHSYKELFMDKIVLAD